MVSTADMSEVNRLEHLMDEDLDPKWNEPSTRGDLRLLAVRIDTKFDQIDGDFRNLTTEINSKFDKFYGGVILFGAIITANLAMFGIFATLIK